MSIEKILKDGFEAIDQVVFLAHQKLDSNKIGVKRKLYSLELGISKDIDNAIFCINITT